MTDLSTNDARLVERRTVHLHAQAWGISFGVLSAVTMFIATIVLVIRGGKNVGAHLGILGEYLPGYDVTVPGAFIGFVYLFVIGYAVGRLSGIVYNFVAHR